jgi:putative ABC transport system substrate-binding protein
MRRRDVILCVGGAAAAWPLGARSQQGDRLKRIGVLIGLSSENSNVRSWVTAFIEELARLGWIDGGNVRVEQRWTNADTMRANSFAKELVALQTDIILTESTPATAALHRETTPSRLCFGGRGFRRQYATPGRQHYRVYTHRRSLGRQVARSS